MLKSRSVIHRQKGTRTRLYICMIRGRRATDGRGPHSRPQKDREERFSKKFNLEKCRGLPFKVDTNDE